MTVAGDRVFPENFREQPLHKRIEFFRYSTIYEAEEVVPVLEESTTEL